MSLSPSSSPPSPTYTPTSTLTPSSSTSTALQTRLQARTSTLTTQTSSLAPTHLQANLLVLPSAYAASFRLLCRRNPVACPLLGETGRGEWRGVRSAVRRGGGGVGLDKSGEKGEMVVLAKDIDLARDAPGYVVYKRGRVVRGGGLGKVVDVTTEWTKDHIGFLIGCSFSFESALVDAGLVPRHQIMGKTVSMYRTSLLLSPAGVFTDSTYVVSMRPYKSSEIEKVREITRPFGLCHGEPIAWGWNAVGMLGIGDLEVPQWGDAPGLWKGGHGAGGMEGSDGIMQEDDEELVPVFWGCGVTPQEAVIRAGGKIDGVVLGHEPGHMIVLDARDSDIVDFDGGDGEE